MRKVVFLLLSLVFIVSCNEGKKKNSDTRVLPESSGRLNNLSVVIDNELWEGRVGEAIRDVLASPVDGLPQDEPLFNMSQIPPSVFSGFAAQNRTVLKIEMGKAPDVKTAKDVYARPQTVVVVSGENKDDIIAEIKDNSKSIIKALKDTEITEQQRRIGLSLHKTKAIEDKLGVSIKFPSAYRIGVEEDDFFWLRKDITTGTTNVMIFTVPFNEIKRGDSLVNQIIKIRDSITKIHIKGRLDGEVDKDGKKIESYMITEKAYAPFITKAVVDQKPAIETRGIWDLKGDFMGGPFLSYAVEDKSNNRWVIVEGFAFAPSVEKREYMFELEAILKSLKIK